MNWLGGKTIKVTIELTPRVKKLLDDLEKRGLVEDRGECSLVDFLEAYPYLTVGEGRALVVFTKLSRIVSPYVEDYYTILNFT